MYHSLLVLLIAVTNFVNCCPPAEILSPCICHEDTEIHCGTNTKFSLSDIFAKLSDNSTTKHFTLFYFNNSVITQLQDNTFHEITFDEILIEEANALTTINAHAFGANNLRVKKFSIKNSPVNPVNIFDIISSFANLEYLFIQKTNITEIPSNAFQPLNGVQSNLKYVYFEGITKIGDYAFYEMDNLQTIHLGYNLQLNSIPVHAFDFRHNSTVRCNIQLYSCGLSEESFPLGVFLNSKRPLYIDVRSNKIKVMDEKIWAPILALDNNYVDVDADPFVCDCKFFWLYKKWSQYSKQVLHLNDECGDGKDFEDPSHFAKC